MKRLGFGRDRAFTIDDPRLDRVTIAPLTASLVSGASVQAAVFRIDPGGGIARHPAQVEQLLAVLAGSGEVAGGDGVFGRVGAGDAVFFEVGEEHETRTDEGLTALIVEGPDIRPHRAAGEEGIEGCRRCAGSARCSSR